MNKYTFLLANISTVNISVQDGNCNVTCHITTMIQDFPYIGKFQQIDYNVVLVLPGSLTIDEANAQLPTYGQAWINTTYPNT